MRKIIRPIPTEQYNNKKKDWLNKFLTEEKSTWNNDYIKVPFLKSSNYKCSYCETKLYNKETKENENKWMNIDHFKAKNIKKYKKLALDWDNFLPLCSACNIAKSDKDVCDNFENIIVINPYDDNIRNEFYYDDGILAGKTKKAITTLGFISYERRNLFNNTQSLTIVLQKQLNILLKFDLSTIDWEKQEDIKLKLEKYLQNGADDSEFCSYSASYIINKKKSKDFIANIKQKNTIWDNKHEELYNQCKENSIDLEINL